MRYFRWIVLTFQEDGNLHQPTEIPIFDSEEKATEWAKKRLERMADFEFQYESGFNDSGHDLDNLRIMLDGVVELHMKVVEAVEETE